MKVNNVYQRRTISIPKIILIVGFIILVVVIFIWRLYYERVQTGTVDTFAEFIGLDSIVNNDKKILGNMADKHFSDNDKYLENQEDTNLPNTSITSTNLYIPKFTEQTINNVNNIYNLPSDGQKKVYLTFDDGPSKDVTPLILDVLKSENIYATFFVLGSRVDQNPDILKRIYNEGHEIANHGYSHIYSQIYGNTQTILDEYNKCEDSIRNALGISEYNTYLFRYPGGSKGGIYNNIKMESFKVLKENKIAILDWNCLTRDSEGNFPKEKLIENFIATSKRKK